MQGQQGQGGQQVHPGYSQQVQQVQQGQGQVVRQTKDDLSDGVLQSYLCFVVQLA